VKFVIGLGLFAVAMFGSIFMVQANHYDDQKIACIEAQGRGKLLHSRTTGMPIGYECMRMHLVLKYRNGEYK
jgi:hypothetical protein